MTRGEQERSVRVSWRSLVNEGVPERLIKGGFEVVDRDGILRVDLPEGLSRFLSRNAGRKLIRILGLPSREVLFFEQNGESERPHSSLELYDLERWRRS